MGPHLRPGFDGPGGEGASPGTAASVGLWGGKQGSPTPPTQRPCSLHIPGPQGVIWAESPELWRPIALGAHRCDQNK